MEFYNKLVEHYPIINVFRVNNVHIIMTITNSVLLEYFFFLILIEIRKKIQFYHFIDTMNVKRFNLSARPQLNLLCIPIDRLMYLFILLISIKFTIFPYSQSLNYPSLMFYVISVLYVYTMYHIHNILLSLFVYT